MLGSKRVGATPGFALLLTVILGHAAHARAGELLEVLVLEVHDDELREGLRARADLLKVVGKIPGVGVAPLAKLTKLARAAHLDDLRSPQATQELCRVAHLAAVLEGTINERNGRRVLHLNARDASGATIYHRAIDLAVGQLLLEDIESISGDLAAVLQYAGELPPRVVMTHVAPDQPVAKPLIETTPQNTTREPRPEPKPARFEDPAFQVELGARGSTMTSSLTDDSQPGGCGTGGAGCLSKLGSRLYPGIEARVQAFPFHRGPEWLQGIGVALESSFSQLQVAGSAPNASLTAHDVRFDGDAVYRLRLGIFHGEQAIYAPSFGVRAGLQLRDFDVPGSALLHPLDRFGARLGAEILEPLGRDLRVALGGVMSLSPTPGQPAEKALQSATTISDGYELDLELQGRLGTSGFTGSLRVTYGEFGDCYERSASYGCNFSGRQASASADALIGYAIY